MSDTASHEFGVAAGELLVGLAARFAEAASRGAAEQAERWASAAFALRGPMEFVDGCAHYHPNPREDRR
jgi:hypothetical protein